MKLMSERFSRHAILDKSDNTVVAFKASTTLKSKRSVFIMCIYMNKVLCVVRLQNI